MKDDKEILNRIKATVQEVEPTSEIILFGSRARGEAREDSDWDILNLIPYAVDLKTEQKFRHKLFDIELEFGQAISTFVHSKSEWEKRFQITPLYQNIKQDGINT